MKVNPKLHCKAERHMTSNAPDWGMVGLGVGLRVGREVAGEADGAVMEGVAVGRGWDGVMDGPGVAKTWVFSAVT